MYTATSYKNILQNTIVIAGGIKERSFPFLRLSDWTKKSVGKP